jgi:hypothetical protein
MNQRVSETLTMTQSQTSWTWTQTVQAPQRSILYLCRKLWRLEPRAFFPNVVHRVILNLNRLASVVARMLIVLFAPGDSIQDCEEGIADQDQDGMHARTHARRHIRTHTHMYACMCVCLSICVRACNHHTYMCVWRLSRRNAEFP